MHEIRRFKQAVSDLENLDDATPRRAVAKFKWQGSIGGNTLVRSTWNRKTKWENKTLARLIMNTKYAVCLENRGYEASLQIGKLYEIVNDTTVETDGMLRVIDEDGEDYLFEAKLFYPLALPSDLAVALHNRP